MDFIPGYEIKKYKEELSKDALMKMLPKRFRFHREPFWHQLLSLVFALQFDNSGNWSQMGAGKTKVAIDLLRAKGIKKDILIVTLKSIIDDWVKAFEIDGGNEYKVKVFTEEDRQDRNRIIEENKHDVYIVNPEALMQITRGKGKQKNLREFILPVLLKKRWNAFLLDESRLFMNDKAKRTRVALYVSLNSKMNIPLCGQPTVKKEEEIVVQQFFIDRGVRLGRNVYDFRREFCEEIKGWYASEYTLKPKHKKTVHRAMYEQAIRFKKDECLDLPPQMIIQRRLELAGEQKRLYDELRKNNGALIITKKNRFAIEGQLNKFRQVCNGFVQKENQIAYLSDNVKMKELVELFSGELAKEKVVVFAYFIEEQKMIYNELKQHKFDVLRMTSDISDEEFNKNYDLFRTDSKPYKMVVSLKKTARGKNFTSAKYGIYYSLDYDTDLMLQSFERFRRPGIEWADKITLIQLICKDTVEEKSLLPVLQKDQKLIDVLVEGKTLNSFV